MTHTDIINLWPSVSDFAVDLGVEYGTAKAMRRRGSIPAEYWLRVEAGANNRAIEGVSLQTLAETVAASKQAGEQAA